MTQMQAVLRCHRRSIPPSPRHPGATPVTIDGPFLENREHWRGCAGQFLVTGPLIEAGVAQEWWSYGETT